MSAWIEMRDPSDPGVDDAELSAAFELVRTPHGSIDNVMRVHSLRPHTLHGHRALYRSVLHDDRNQLPTWFLEAVGCLVSSLNRCDYSLSHHLSNLRQLVDDDARATAMIQAITEPNLESAFSGKELALLRYARKLTVDVGAMAVEDIGPAREAGASDAELFEVNQVCGYFAYANRLLNGLGVTTDGDDIGYYTASSSEPDEQR